MAQVTKKTIAGKRGRITVAVELDRAVDKAVSIAAIERDTTKRQLIEDAIRAYLRLGSAAA